MGRKKRPKTILRWSHLVCWLAAVARDAVEAHQHGRSRSSAAAFAANAAAPGVRLGRTSTSKHSGAFSRGPHLGAPLLLQQQQRDSQKLLRRGQNGVSRGQCLMGVAGLTGYIDQNFRGAVAMEDLREVSSAWVMGNGRACSLLSGLPV